MSDLIDRLTGLADQLDRRRYPENAALIREAIDSLRQVPDGRAFQPGDRVEWQASFGEWIPGKIAGVRDRVTTYDIHLDDGSAAEDFPASRIRKANPAAPTSGVDLFRTARKVVRLVENDHWHDDARDALWCEIDNEILSAAYEIEEYRAARAASMPSVDSVIAEVDGLLETQGRLQFAQDNYNEEEAADFGVRLLDFMRRHGVAVRLALFQWSHGEPASLKRDGEDRAPTRPEASLKRPDNPAGSAISANNPAANAACNYLARMGYVWDGEAWATKATPAQAGAVEWGSREFYETWHEIEAVLLRRMRTNKLDGYTIETAQELAQIVNHGGIAQAGAELPEHIDPSSRNFKEGLAVGMSCEQRLAEFIRNPVCHMCGARNAEEASKMCSPDGDSCPGCEFPLANLWGDA